MNEKRTRRDPALNMYLAPDKGSWGVFIKRGHKVVEWNSLHSWEKEKIINYMEFVVKLFKNEKN